MLSSQTPPLGAIVRAAIQTLADHITPVATAAAVVVFPMTIWEGALPSPSGGATATTTALTAAQLSHLVAGLRPWFLPAAVDAVATYLMTAAVVFILAEAMHGRSPGALDGYRAVLGRLGPLVSAGIAQLLVVFAISVVFSLPLVALHAAAVVFLLVVAMVCVGVYMSLVTQVVMREGIGFARAIRRSAQLVSGAFWPVLGLVLIGAVVSALFSTLSTLPLSVGDTFATRALSELIAALIAVTVGILPSALLTAFYEERSAAAPPQGGA